MGMSYSQRRFYEEQTPAEKARITRAANAKARALVEAETAKRMALADKIVMVIVDRIAADIIRPGPKPEERECYVMAQELRDHTRHLSELVSAVLKIEEDEG